jgi:hypothetical protein
MKPSQLFSHPKWFALLLPLVLIACKENGVSHPPYIEPSMKDRAAFYPLYIGNQWAYVDSLGPSTTVLRVQTVTSYTEEDNLRWWGLDLGGSVMELTLANDSVYLRSKQNGVPAPFLAYIPPSMTGKPQVFIRNNLTHDTVLVRSLDHSFVTPAGSFDSVLVFETNLHPGGRSIQYFRPRIGVLGSEQYFDTTRVETTHLVYYKLFR